MDGESCREAVTTARQALRISINGRSLVIPRFSQMANGASSGFAWNPRRTRAIEIRDLNTLLEHFALDDLILPRPDVVARRSLLWGFGFGCRDEKRIGAAYQS